jgi:hypothetical protein
MDTTLIMMDAICGIDLATLSGRLRLTMNRFLSFLEDAIQKNRIECLRIRERTVFKFSERALKDAQQAKDILKKL